MIIGGIFIKIALATIRIAKTVFHPDSYHIGGDLCTT